MADFPITIYSERATENLPGIVFDPTKKQNLYAEDFQHHAAEIIAIEEILGENPQGLFATVKEWLESLGTGGGVENFGNFNGGSPSSVYDPLYIADAGSVYSVDLVDGGKI